MIKQKLLSLLVVLCCTTSIFAYDAYIDGIYYNFNSSNRTATVTCRTNSDISNSYSGDVIIPSSISYQDQVYSVTSIGHYTFGGSKNLNSVKMPNTIISIGAAAFFACTSLTSIIIPNSVTTINDEAFSSCTLLRSITIPNSVTTIGERAFYDCSQLTSIVVESGNSKYDSRNNSNAIIETTTNTLIAGCKNTIIPNSVTTIGEYAFAYCSGLTSVTIPNSVTMIGGHAFKGCSGLTSVTIPNSVTTIGDEAFYKCSALTSITIPASVDSIYIGHGSILGDCSSLAMIVVEKGNSTYDSRENCNAIIETATNTLIVACKNTVIPNSVTEIGSYAFKDCSGLTSVTIGNSVKTIGYDAFYDCDSLTKTNYTGTIADWCKIQFNSSNSNPITFSHNFFINNAKVKDLVIPEGIDKIGNYAFYNCSSLTSITIPNSVKTIGGSAFYNCKGLTLVKIPNSVTTIGSSAFYGVNTIVYNGTATGSPWGARHAYYVDGYLYYKDASKTFLMECSKDAVGEIIIPNSVTTIGGSAFDGCIGLTSVTIPNSVTEIGDFAFNNCSGLTSVTIPNSVTTIRNATFQGCSGLTSVTIPNSVTTIGEYAFNICTGLTSIAIPNSVTTIGENAFYLVNNIVYKGTTTGSPWGAKCVNGYVDDYLVYSDATKTTLCGCSSAATGEITIPNSVTEIGDYAFSLCFGFTLVTIPNSVTEIGDYAFSGVNNIVYGGTAAGSPWGAKCVNGYVDDYLVYSDATKTTLCGCSSAATGEITIPNSVTTIGESAFYRCSGLTSITCYSDTPPTCGSYCFSDVKKSISVYVPAQSVDAYKQADVWQDFTNILPIGAEIVPSTDEVITQPSANSVTITWPQSENADTYTLEIRKNGDLICTLTFNNQGIMTNITFAAPARGGERTASEAEMTVNGYKFTVTGLETNTEYTYAVTAKNTSAQPIQTYSGSFKTTEPTGLEDLTIDKKVGNKFIYGNHLYIRCGDKIYNAAGGLMK